MKAITRLLASLHGRRDLAFVAILMITIGVMIVPMPTVLLDGLIAMNLTLTVVVLLVAVYLDRSTSFSTFPAVILVATTFRLAISISTTRSVLTEGDAGEIVGTFGRFVTGNNVAVGLVIFLIISIVQFIVVTKGAERVAEVAARFVLDALPGRQMSIDGELRAGDIDAEEARRRRRQIDKENQFFGAMDGAMKFVKGDAIAGLLIVAVNLVGGLVIGLVQFKMPLAQAAKTFSLLTVGDGLVAQIPALLIAMCAGIVITRVTSEETSDLGSDILGELAGSVRGLGIAGVLVMAFGLVPGFPTAIFLVFGAALAILSLSMSRRSRKALAAPEAGSDPVDVRAGDRVRLSLGADLAATLDRAAFAIARDAALAAFERRSGMRLPTFGFEADPAAPPGGVAVSIDGVPLTDTQLPVDCLLVRADASLLKLAGVEPRPAGDLSRRPGVALAPSSAEAVLRGAGVPILGPAEVLAEYAVAAMADRIEVFVGFDLVQSMLRDLRNTQPELADQVMTAVATGRILEVLRRLAAERVPLVPVRRLFETLVEWAPREPDTAVLAERVRGAMSHQICHALADEKRVIPGYVVEPDLAEALRGAIRQTDNGAVLALPAAHADRLLAGVAQIRVPLDPSAPRPVVVVDRDLRRHLQGYLAGQGIDHPVLSFGEVSREFTVHPVGTLSLGPRQLGLAA